MSYTTERTNADVLTVRIDEVKAGWEQWFLLTSDVHWDNPHCDRALYKRHLDQAVERKAGIFCFGDFFCCMGGKYDPRSNKEGIRPEHQVANYFDALIDTAGDYLEPYKGNFVLLSPGNHETAILKRQETNLTARLTHRLGVQSGGYAGFVRFLLSRGSSARTSKTLFYHHGYGGGGPVTKGTIQTNRRAVWLPDAEIVCSGHVHEAWYLEVERQRVSLSGEPYIDTQYHLQLPTYKQEHTLAGGWHIERGAPPKPLGAWWLRMHYDNSKRDAVGLEFTRAT